MADVYVTINLNDLVEKAQIGTIDALNDLAVDFATLLAEELPPGVAAKSITIRPSNAAGDTFTVSVGIVDEGVLKYLWGYWKGKPEIVDIYAKNSAFMKFDRWKNGNTDLKWKDGFW